MRELVRALALALRGQVLPHLGSHAGRAHESEAEGGEVQGGFAPLHPASPGHPPDTRKGDITFWIDEIAERTLERFLAEHAPDVAFYSEDRGLVSAGDARAVLVVDPIDGTRPALAGLESCCVSVAAAPLPDPTMGDVDLGCVVEIPSGTVFLAERGAGLYESPPARLSANEAVERMFWTYGFRGRPARPTTEVLAELIDASSVGGASFDLGSATFDMTRIVTGQLDAYVEPGPRLVADAPGMREQFERVGGGAVLNNSPYDLAAATLVLEEAGAIVTDAYGASLSDRPLLGSGADFQMSVVAAANPVLHERVLAMVDDGVRRVSG